MADWTPEIAYDQFLLHETTIRAAMGTNEATTRLRAIDTMLFLVIGWDKTEVDTELYCREEGYADYAFRARDSISLILEAKRQGQTFVLPKVDLPASPVGFSLLAKESPEAESALRQALGYAASEGARYIAITNGHQWLLTLTFVQNQRIEQRSVFVFESLEAIKKKFRLFFECFSPAGINGNRAANRLLESRKAPAPPKLSSRILNYPVPAARNVISNELHLATMGVVDEVRTDESSTEFLKNCYVTPTSTEASLQQAQEIVNQRLSLDKSIRNSALDVSEVENVLRMDVQEKPIIILGKVGHGKTTFLRYLQRLRAPELFKNYVQLQIDFIDRPDSAAQVGGYVYSEIERQLRDDYSLDINADNIVRGFLYIDIQRFKNSYEGRQYPEESEGHKQAERQFVTAVRRDQHEYLGKVFSHLRRGRLKDGKGYSVAVFLDNLDRRSDEIQEEAFLRASAMARDWSALVFVCLRPNTYFRSRHFGVLDSVSPRVVNVSSPGTRFLVSKRLMYARRIALGIVDSTRALKGVPFSKDISLKLPSVASFLEACAVSFEVNEKLNALFDAVSNGNARDILTYVQRVITSLHLDTDKILRKIQSGGYTMPDHEALRALLFGDSMHYDPEQSVFINLFDITRADPSEHFTRLLILKHLGGVSRGYPTYGYLSTDEAKRYMCQLGYSDEHVMETIAFLFGKGCIEPKLPVDAWTQDVSDIRITDRGSYMVRGLVWQFNYIDAIIVDTPIIDPKYKTERA